jgi:hypothetical protein
MNRFKKIVLGLSATLGIIVAITSLYLFTDSPFPDKDTTGLLKTQSNKLASGKSVEVTRDSLAKNIASKGVWFVDQSKRVMILHGVNLGGSSKLPYTPMIPSHQKENFYESAYTVSFTGRPFPLQNADEHFKRLYQWGYRFIRLVITWEGIEHSGPGQYDQEYLNYILEIVKKAAAYNINVFIDPHQDVWSRFTGGDGAPYWTLEKAGFDPRTFTETGAAFIHNIQGDPFPRMIWPTNGDKLGAATMFTLFFGGNDFAPHLKVNGFSIQDYLQDHYIDAVRQVALKLKGMPNVIGFDTFNEPGVGYIGMGDLNSLGIIKSGLMPTPFEGMALAAGNVMEVGKYEFKVTGAVEKERVKVNPAKISSWVTIENDIWKEAGVWGYDKQKKATLLKPDYFAIVKGKRIDFSADYFKPFATKFTDALHAIDPHWLIFVETAPLHELPVFSEKESSAMVNAGHWYDGIALLTKEYYSWFGANVVEVKPVFGKSAVRRAFHDNMAHKKDETLHALGNQPTLVGEFGIPFDLNNKGAYQTGDFSKQELVLDRSFQAMESNRLSYTLWNYCMDNDNASGDQWNGEDLSIFSVSQQKNVADLNSGGRALSAAIRPYPYKVAGEPLEYFFDRTSNEFYFKFKRDKSITLPTEIFIPEFHFGNGFEVLSSAGRLKFDKESELLLFYPAGDGEQIVVVKGVK